MKIYRQISAIALSILISENVHSAGRTFSIELDKIPSPAMFIYANADGGAGTFDTVISKQVEIDNDHSGITLFEFDASVRNYDPSGPYLQTYALNACFRMMVDGIEVDTQYYIVQEKKWEVAEVSLKSLHEFSAGTHLIEIEAGRCWDNVPPFQFIRAGKLKTVTGL